MRLVFATPTDIADPRGGRAMLARLHRDALAALLGGEAGGGLYEYQITGGAGLSARLVGQVNGATPSQTSAIVAAIDAHAADTLWLDGSNLGRIAQWVKQARPQIRVLVFCHNVEARFFLGALRRALGPHAAGVLLGNFLAERAAMRHADDVVALSARDGEGLRRLYGRRADHLLPMALTDQLEPDRLDPASANDGQITNDASLLFVGGAFYANQDGIAWFADQVAPRLSVTTDIVGQGMAAMRETLERAPGMRVLGAVDQLQPLYRHARLVIAPIFDGSGMKTKVAEALMFGKHVAGTPEAFSGYAPDVVAANLLCADADAFAAAIADAAYPAWDPAMRALYERDHSPAAARGRLAAILGLAVTGAP